MNGERKLFSRSENLRYYGRLLVLGLRKVDYTTQLFLATGDYTQTSEYQISELKERRKEEAKKRRQDIIDNG